jgi:hypothetical protein
VHRYLKKVLCGVVLFKMEEDQDFEMILESHLKRPVAL